MFYDINKGLCETYVSLNPLELLEYPAEDVFNLINQTIDYNRRQDNRESRSSSNVIRRQAGDNWF